MSKAWADVENSAPTSPLSPGPGKKLVKRMVERQPTGADLRKKWAPFGLSLDPGNEEGLTARDKTVYLELGTVDPLEKACRDEVMSLMHNSTNIRVDVPLRKHLEKMRKDHAIEATQIAQANAGPSSPTDGGGDGEKRTWAQARKAKTDSAGGAAGAAKAAAAPQVQNVIRVSNLVDSISPAEVHRLFGPENGLANIQRLFIAKDSKGDRRGFCYITYKTSNEAQAAITKMNRKPFRNVILLVDFGTAQGGGGPPGGRR
jgi:hypothetical protein